METALSLQAILNIGIVGAVLSVIIEAVNQAFSSRPSVSKLITLVLCLVTGSAYVWLMSTPYLATVGIILSSSSLVYAFVYNKKQ